MTIVLLTLAALIYIVGYLRLDKLGPNATSTVQWLIAVIAIVCCVLQMLGIMPTVTFVAPR